jgi:hypothetical protein
MHIHDAVHYVYTVHRSGLSVRTPVYGVQRMLRLQCGVGVVLRCNSARLYAAVV